MKKEVIKSFGKKLVQIITKTPVKDRKNRKGEQYYTSKTTYKPIR